MTQARREGLILFLLGSAMFLLLGLVADHFASISMGDFRVVYYSARCLLQHGDPYKESDVLRIYKVEGLEDRPGELERIKNPVLDRLVKTRYFYLPPAFTFTVPVAMLGYAAGHIVWRVLSAASLLLAGFLIWRQGERYDPVVSGLLVGFLLMNSFWLFMIGNSSAIVIGFCAIAAWCFTQDRYRWAGVVCLAAAIALKPHDAGQVWLLFLLAGGTYFKRALQTLLAVGLLALPALLWVSYQSPHWMQELQINMLTFSQPGGLTDPGPAGLPGSNMDTMVPLQSAVSLFWDDPRIYNTVTYALCGSLFLVWLLVTIRRPLSPTRVWLALAVIAPLSMLPVYHMQHDAKLILLAIPACAMLWAEGGAVGWSAFLITGAGIVVNGDIFSALRILATGRFHPPLGSSPGNGPWALFARPDPVILLIMAVFYLWIYVRRSRQGSFVEAPSPKQASA